MQIYKYNKEQILTTDKHKDTQFLYFIIGAKVCKHVSILF